MTLDELIAMVLDFKLQRADPEDDLAMLHMADCVFDNDETPLEPPGLVLAALAVGPGFVMAPIARLLIATCEPSGAALALPSWSARFPEGQSLKTYGVTAVRDLPADMVQDSLVIYGEDMGGASVLRMYVIERDENGDRVWVKQPAAKSWSSHFKDLFVLPKALKATLGYGPQFGLTHDEARYHAKRAVLRLLREAAGTAMAKCEAN